jgi:hypothetical protein
MYITCIIWYYTLISALQLCETLTVLTCVFKHIETSKTYTNKEIVNLENFAWKF